jgi:predicted SAM-dependent methyltransferase
MQIEIGPGHERLGSDWVTVNAIPTPVTDHVCEWGRDPLPFADQAAQLIYASHVLEHVPWMHTVEALREAYRVLKVGGTMEVWVPDFAKIAQGYQTKQCMDGWRRNNPTGDPMVWVNARIFTYGPDPNWHRAVFDAAYLKQCMQTAGFRHVRPNPNPPRGYDHGAINLGCVGVKETV